MKKVFISLAVLAVSAATFVAVNVTNRLDEQFERNVEALAQTEQSTGKTCYNSIKTSEGLQVRYCPICDFVPGDKTIFAVKKSC